MISCVGKSSYQYFIRRLLMKCSNCGNEVTVGAMFCQNCGTKVVMGMKTTISDISREWLKEVLTQGGFNEVTFSDQDENVLIATHPKLYNCVFRIKKDSGFILATSSFTAKKKGLGQDKGFLIALNAANANAWMNTFSCDNDGDLAISRYYWMSEQITDRDIIGFIQKTNDDIILGMNKSNMLNFIQ
jgi:DNA-directed RNA polymerase subunit RPC12/RpoP